MLPNYLKSVALNYIIAHFAAVFVNVVFDEEDKILIKNLYQLTGNKATELMNKFPNKIMVNKK